ncbi:lytic transglycosylase domain-containing protein [Roseicyclus elongatus]|nr:lytic transglycosylase domain-containing protein [Roseibacterium elongatum]
MPKFSMFRALLTVGVIGWPTIMLAQTAAPEAQDTFRRITAPEAGHAGPRITVQIRPGDNFLTPGPEPMSQVAAATPSGPSGGAASDRSMGAAWFWDVVDPQLPADPARYWAARRHLASASEVATLGTPRLNDLHRLADTHGRDLLRASIGTQISPALALAVMAVESAGRAQVTSPAGAQGLMQLMPDTATRFGVVDAFDPLQNITGGIAYLDWLMGTFDRDPILVLAAYNAGEGAVRRAGGVPDYAETRTYVPRVLAAWEMARNLCRTPPELVSDGCVFQPLAVQ